ncbi:MAG: hypothetical protein BV458_11510 [Thermoplasmata archaeon M9B2D]|nr:MAG: hypothetical protein BV458_11510 [Thermoplasmata archaeon M9B2D]
MSANRSREIAKVLRNSDLSVKELCTGLDYGSSEIPAVVVDRLSYPGVEAHLFTIADAAQWKVEFTDEHDVLLSRPSTKTEDIAELVEGNAQAWNRLISILSCIMESMHLYKLNITRGEFATVIWGHHATEWHREMWESKAHEYVHPADFIEYVDTSIRAQITELNSLGFATIESCSGLLIDHPDREPYKPYVMFDERSYHGSAPHFFTLGDMAGWESMYAPHGFDVYIRVFSKDDIVAAWSRLMSKARILSPLLSRYRSTRVETTSSYSDQDRLSNANSNDPTQIIIDDANQRFLGPNGLQ